MSTLQVLRAHEKDLGGGFVVRRLLPAAERQAVGPFVFLDHFGPIVVQPTDQHDVRPHPHIGLATVTYLFEGAMMHRDSTGVVQRIEPGAINWMHAGRGIVHSERAPDDLRPLARRMHGLQMWVALPEALEESAPWFSHTAVADLPEIDLPGARLRVLVGEAYGRRSPVPASSPTLYLDLRLEAGAMPFELPALARERALYAVDGQVTIDGQALLPHTLLVLEAGHTPRLEAPLGARVVVIGGEPLGHRHLWWNFAASRRERLVQAADDWAAARFDAVPGETEFIPLPERRPTA